MSKYAIINALKCIKYIDFPTNICERKKMVNINSK